MQQKALVVFSTTFITITHIVTIIFIKHLSDDTCVLLFHVYCDCYVSSMVYPLMWSYEKIILF